jgi:hypothetical protein
MFIVSRITLLSVFIASFALSDLKAQTSTSKDLSLLCAKAGFSIQPKAEGFNLYLYQKAFLSFDRIDNFRLEDMQAVYLLENGEASITLASANEMRSKNGKAFASLGSKQAPIRFILNVNGQVKEQPLN